VNLALSLALMFPLGHAGLALATVFGAMINAALLFAGLVREGVYRPVRGWRRLLAQGLGSSLVMGLTLWVLRGPTMGWIELAGVTRLWRLCLLLGVGVLVYAAALLVLGMRPRHLLQQPRGG